MSGRVVDEVPVAALRLLQLLVQARVRDRDRHLVGEELQEDPVLLVERVPRRGLDGDGADEPIRTDEWRRHHRADALVADAGITLVVREAVVGEVVAGEADRAVRRRPAGDPRPDRHHHVLRRGRHRRGRDRSIQLTAAIGHQVHLRAVGPQQAGRIGHRALDDRQRVVEPRDLGRDLGQRALRVGAAAELVVEARVRDRHRRLPREQLDELEVVLAERHLGAAGAADVHRPDHLVAGRERDDDDRLLLDRRAGDLGRARIGARVVEQHRLAVLHAPPGQALAARDREAEHRRGVLLPGQDRRQHVGVGVHAVDGEVVVRDHRLQAVGHEVEDAGRVERGEQALVDRQQPALRVDLARQRGGLLAQAGLGLDQLVVEARVRDGDRGLVGEQCEHLLVIRGPGVAAA